MSHRAQGTYALRQGQDKVLRRIGAVFQEKHADESHLALRLPGGPTSAAPAAAAAEPSPPPDTSRAAAADAPAEVSDDGAPRVKGPAMPSEALRRAAAGAAAAMRSQGLLDAILDGVSAALVGPVPEALLAEADGAAADERTAQVERILAVVAKHSRSGMANHLG